MAIKERHLRNATLPVAILCGLLFHKFLSSFYPLVPWLLAAMMLQTCTKISISKMRVRRVHLMLLAVQVFVSIGLYFAVRNINEPLAQGLMICVFTPVATASPVVGALLGADVTLMTTYVLLSNITTAVLAPFVFSYINPGADITFVSSFLRIMQKTMLLLVFPMLLSWLMEKFTPKAHKAVKDSQYASFYLWAVCMMVLIGSALHSIMTSPETDLKMDIIMAACALVLCIVLFSLGRFFGKRYGDMIAIRQMLGQKNTGAGVWMTLSFLNPVASVVPTAYIVWQNIMNSIEIARKD